jgi:hypothetical protein
VFVEKDEKECLLGRMLFNVFNTSLFLLGSFLLEVCFVSFRFMSFNFWISLLGYFVSSSRKGQEKCRTACEVSIFYPTLISFLFTFVVLFFVFSFSFVLLDLFSLFS